MQWPKIPLLCPSCEREIKTNARDGAIVACPFCGASGELHNDEVLDLTTNQTSPVRLLEPLE